MAKKINLPCSGNGGTEKIPKASDTITFETSGNCTFTGFNFTGGTGDPYYPPGFSNKTPADGVGASVSYSYDGTAIPDAGYTYEFSVTTPKRGNGSGTIKNS
jgi:hypothetical protein